MTGSGDSHEVDIEIPNEWRAFSLLVQTQSKYSLDFIRESVHNALDANASKIHVFIEREKRLPVAISVTDNGTGAPSSRNAAGKKSQVLFSRDDAHPEWGETGRPQLEYIPRHAADSLKAQAPRTNTVGEFGIGLYTFWALGEKLTLTTRARRPNGLPTECWALTMLKNQRGTRFDQVPIPEGFPITGTSVRVENMVEEALPLLRRDKVATWLSVQLRQRLLSLGKNVHLDVAGSDEESKVVEPRKYSGQSWDSTGKPRKFNTPFGPVVCELYLLPETTSGDTGVAVTSNASLGYRRISDIEQLSRYPWNTTKIQGSIEFPAGRPTPSHDGFLPGKELNGFIQKMLQITPEIERDLKQVEERQHSELDRKTRERLLRAFAEGLKELDPNEYSPFKAKGGRGAGTAVDSGREVPTELGQTGLRPESVLSLDHVTIHPSTLHILPEHRAEFRATAHDGAGRVIRSEIRFEWSIIIGGHLAVFDSDPRASFVSLLARSALGPVTLRVTARQDSTARHCDALLDIVQKLPKKRRSERTQPGVPTPDLRKDWPLESYRSKYDRTFNQIVINSTHPDFIRASNTGAPRDRETYILTAMSKELLIYNFQNDSVESILDRVVEVLPIVLRRL
jgi:hypothetical protein